MQPDNRVTVLICVEGPHDVTSLQQLSRTLHQADPETYPDLITDPRFAFVPQGGGTLKQWVSNRYLKGFNRPEFHLYDNDVDEYKVTAMEVNARGDGSVAFITSKLMMENYLHPDAIYDALGVRVAVTADCNVPNIVSEATQNSSDVRPMNKGIVKSRLANAGFAHMTLERLNESDPDGDVKEWFAQLSQMAQL